MGGRWDFVEGVELDRWSAGTTCIFVSTGRGALPRLIPAVKPRLDEVHGVDLWPCGNDRMAEPEDDEAAWRAGNRFDEDVDAEGDEDEPAACATRSQTARDDFWDERAFVECLAFRTRPVAIAA